MSRDGHDEFEFAYLAYERQVEREDRLYQQRTNFSIAVSGSLLVFYGGVLGGDFALKEAQFVFLLLICTIGFLSAYAFERQIDRGYRYLQEVKREFVDRHQEEAERRKLPMPSMPREQYRDYPFSEITMFLMVLWVMVALVTIVAVWGGIVVGYDAGPASPGAS